MILFSKKCKQKNFYWEGTNSEKKILSGEMIAYSKNLVKMALHKKNIQTTLIKRKRKNIFIRQKLSLYERILFFRQLATLLPAGIPLLQAIQVISQRTDNVGFVTLGTALQTDINAGLGLAAGLRKFPTYFDTMTCHLIEAGEKTGTLDNLLERVATHYEHIAKLRKSIIQALFYPLVTLSIAALITLIMLTVVTPRFTALFNEMHAPLPAFTQAVIVLSNVIRDCFIPFFISIVFFSLLFSYFKTTRFVRSFSNQLWISLPIIGTFIRKLIVTRFTKSLATLLAASLPLTEALEMLAATTGNIHYEKAIKKMSRIIATGQQLHDAIQHVTLFPPTLHRMIKIGEESGTLEKMLLKSAEFEEATIHHFITTFSQLMEPLIMTILGVLIGSLVIAMYLPIFKLGSVI